MILYLNKNSDISKMVDEIKILEQEYKNRTHIEYPSIDEKKYKEKNKTSQNPAK